MMRTLPTKEYIEKSDAAINTITSFPEVAAISSRYIGRGKIDANYKNAVGPNQNFDSVFTPVAGIDPENENLVTNIGSLMLEGKCSRTMKRGVLSSGKI